MAVSDHMIVGYNQKRIAIAVGYGDSFDSAESDYFGHRNHERHDEVTRKIVEIVRYRKSPQGWEEVKNET